MPEAATLEPPVTPPTPPAAHPGAVTIDLANLGKKPVKAEVVVTDAEKATAEAAAKAAAEAKATTDAAAVAAAAAATEAAKKPAGDKEHNMAELRKAREAAEAARKTAEDEVTRLRGEYEALKTKAPELPEEVKGKLSKFEELEKEREELRRTLRQTDLARDPEFQAKYNKPITERISLMGQTALAAGIAEADWKAAVGEWNETQFAEWSEGMNALQRVEFQTAWMDAKSLYRKQQSELQNADVAYQELQKQRQADAEAQQKQYFTTNEQLARSVMADTLKPETLKEYEDLGGTTEALLMKAARHEIPAKEIFQQLAANQVLARVTMKQKSRIDELEAQIAERDKKITEQDTFIANQAAGVPRGDAAGSSGPTGKSGPIWSNLVVKAPG